ncbi:MAG TPA: tetratricopeptide repeat protein [Thermoanaerobaculia bacterium]|nr:tetratricopeptide repeat protein [Thermoanaerobaculia bacterium]
MRRTVLLPAIVLAVPLLTGVAAPPAAAQTPETAPSAAPAPDPEAVRLVQRAMAEVEQGKLAAAIAVLEPVRYEPTTPAQALALLGALYLETRRAEDAYAVLAPLARREDANAAVLYNAGRAALVTERIEEGIAYLERSVALEPTTPAARELGLLRGFQGQAREAYRLLVPWARSNPEDGDVRRAAALAALRLKRVPEAEELLSGLPQDDPGTRFLWGHLLLLQGDPQGAVAALRPLLDEPELSEPLRADARRVLAEAYLEVGEARSTVEILEGHAAGPSTALTLARAWYQSGEAEKAIETLRPFAEPLLGSELVRTDPRWPVVAEILREYGRWLLATGRGGDSVQYLRAAAELEPEEKQAWQSLGQALAATGDAEGAKAALAKFQELAEAAGSETEQVARLRERREDPTASELDRARRLLAQGDPASALEVVSAEISLAPDDPRPYLLASRILLLLERPQDAFAAVERALGLAPDSADAIYQRGTVQVALGAVEQGEADLRHALALAPDHVPALNDLAVVLLVRGERQEARRLLERVLELRPGEPEATATLERLEGG